MYRPPPSGIPSLCHWRESQFLQADQRPFWENLHRPFMVNSWSGSMWDPSHTHTPQFQPSLFAKPQFPSLRSRTLLATKPELPPPLPITLDRTVSLANCDSRNSRLSDRLP